VLDVPSATQAGATPPAEATQIITAQSRDFNAFRNRLAGAVPNVQMADADRRASGRVQAQLDDKRPGTAAPDKLTLSKGALKTQAEEKIARDKAANDAATRVAELSKNISDLNKLGVASSGSPAPATAAPAPAPSTTPAPTAATAPSTAPTAPSTAPTVAAPTAPPPPASAEPPPAAASASAPAATPAPATTASAPPAPATEPVASDSWMDSLRDNPLIPFAAAALVALLAGFGFYRARQRKKAAELDSAFLESRLQPDSFFGASGGQHVDTSDDENGPASSMSYSPSQLDAAGDVDPVAEADVYLAYGRDLQAEEILREALRNTPNRVAIHTKLLEIYAKRRDATSFGPLAANAFELTEGQGPDWDRISQLGRELEPDNGLYQAGATAETAVALNTASSPLDSTMPTASAPLDNPATASAPLPPLPAMAAFAEAPPAHVPEAPRATPDALDFDLDLDLSHNNHLPERAVAAAAAAGAAGALAATHTSRNATPAEEAELAEPADVEDDRPASIDLDFDLDDRAYDRSAADATAAPLTVPAALDLPGQPAEPDALNFDIDLSDVSEPEPRPEPAAPSRSAPAPLATPTVAPLAAAHATPADPAVLGALAPAPASPPDSGMIEFDLGSLTLDLGDSSPGGAAAEAADHAELPTDDPLATKLALAEEFSSIGDEDGARALAEEVLEEATGSLRARAQRFLTELSS
ncbi:MAG: hypothetical protein JWP29_837, partial [Rhodoferax sp.]|nr:hypothetical protein [Rhodoferax sp.]